MPNTMLIKPLITEKSLRLSRDKKYTFVVSREDTKTIVKRNVEKTFGVNVVSVHTSTTHGKTYRAGRKGQMAQASDWKKAIVGIKKDQNIDLFDAPKE